ncbi:hypothetical protein AB9K28_06475 [Enterobacter asburiae]
MPTSAPVLERIDDIEAPGTRPQTRRLRTGARSLRTDARSALGVTHIHHRTARRPGWQERALP